MLKFKELLERIDMKKASMGDVIKDFQDSDAPQFKGKSPEKRRQMAIAAKMAKEEVEQIDELTGGQEKIDANKNGKIDADDFKKLRSKKVAESSDLKPFIVVHAKHGKFETHAGSTYEAAKNAAAHWKTKKGTAGMDVHRADITHSTQHVG